MTTPAGRPCARQSCPGLIHPERVNSRHCSEPCRALDNAQGHLLLKIRKARKAEVPNPERLAILDAQWTVLREVLFALSEWRDLVEEGRVHAHDAPNTHAVK